MFISPMYQMSVCTVKVVTNSDKPTETLQFPLVRQSFLMSFSSLFGFNDPQLYWFGSYHSLQCHFDTQQACIFQF